MSQVDQRQRERKSRRDKGARLITPRDEWVLAWVAEQYAVRFDQLQQLLSRQPGHHSERYAPGLSGITASAVDQVVARWEAEPAWACYRRFHADAPGWVWATSYGIDMLHGRGLLSGYGRHVLRESTLEHLYWINHVRLDTERRHPEFRWVSERTLRKTVGRRGEGEGVPHISDGQVWLDRRRVVAVEVELSPKSEQEYAAIFDELLVCGVSLGRVPLRYTTVWYFVTHKTVVNAQAARMVEGARKRLPEHLQSRVKVIPLEQVGVVQSG